MYSMKNAAFVVFLLFPLTTLPSVAIASTPDIQQKVESTPDVSIAGQIAYACALVQRIRTTYGPVDTWREKGVAGLGNGASATIEASAAASLFGVWVGADHRAGYDGHFAADARDVVMGIQRLDTEQIQTGMHGLAADCAKL